MLQLDYRSVVRLASVARCFRELRMTLSKDKILHRLLRLEISDPEQHLKKRDLFPCYGCFRVLPPPAFLDFKDMPAFYIGGRCT